LNPTKTKIQKEAGTIFEEEVEQEADLPNNDRDFY